MPVHRLVNAIRHLFRQPPARRPAPHARPQLQALEERWVPALNPMAVINGSLYLDSNGNNVRDAGEFLVRGARVTLIGQTTAGTPVNTFVTTDAAGLFRFRVDLGNYTLIAASAGFIGNAGLGHSVLHVRPNVDGQTLNVSIAFARVWPGALSLRRFLASTPVALPPLGPAGSGGVGNRAPTVREGIANVNATASTTRSNIDLSRAFDDADMATSWVRMHTNRGRIDLNLFDRIAPATVANFYGYINRNDYDNVIFHRLGAFLHGSSTVRDVLQGGQFKFSSSGGTGQLTDITDANTPTVRDEVSLPNTAGTIAMAKTGSPNSATSQFFFNLIDNTNQLSVPPQTNGGFTVFGRYANSSQPVIDLLKTSNVENVSNVPGFSSLTDLPLRDGAEANFPGGTVASDYLLIQDVEVMRRNEFLTYSIVSNTNANLVTPTIDNNRLVLTYAAGQSGTARITVQATDRFGASVTTSFVVNRSA